MDLFHISPGVPCDYALEQASTLLGVRAQADPRGGCG
ncbi:DUF3077 domain-containing protein [Pseudomonas aeruginosa]